LVFKPIQEQFSTKGGSSNPFESSSVKKVGLQTRSGAVQSKMWVFKPFRGTFSPKCRSSNPFRTIQFKMWVLKPVWKQFSPKGGFSKPFRSSSVQNVGLHKLFRGKFSPKGRSSNPFRAVQYKMWVLKPVWKQFSPKGRFSNPFRSSSIQNAGFQTRSEAVQ
jgi:hypothetical protein